MPLHPVRLARDIALERVAKLEKQLGIDSPIRLCSLLTLGCWRQALLAHDQALSPEMVAQTACELEIFEKEVLAELHEEGVDVERLLIIMNAGRELIRAEQDLRRLEDQLAALDHQLEHQRRVRRAPLVWRLGPKPGHNEILEDDFCDLLTEEFPTEA